MSDLYTLRNAIGYGPHDPVYQASQQARREDVMEKKIIVPTEMVNATSDVTVAWGDHQRMTLGYDQRERIIAAALRWLSDHPMVPTEQQVVDLIDTFDGKGSLEVHRIVEWQRKMFLAPDEDEPIRDLIENFGPAMPGVSLEDAKAAVREAFRRGQQSQEKK